MERFFLSKSFKCNSYLHADSLQRTSTRRLVVPKASLWEVFADGFEKLRIVERMSITIFYSAK